MKKVLVARSWCMLVNCSTEFHNTEKNSLHPQQKNIFYKFLIELRKHKKIKKRRLFVFCGTTCGSTVMF